MNYHCTECGLAGDLERMVLATLGTDLEVRCPRCFLRLARYVDSSLVEEEASVEPYLPTSNESRYALHLYQKQLGKLNAAADQINNMITKTQILLELAKEREAMSGDDTD